MSHMTQFPVPDAPGAKDPANIHAAEQMWGTASDHVDTVVAALRETEPRIYANAGENTDASVLFDYLKGYIQYIEHEEPEAAHTATILLCAAALTKLVRAPRTSSDDLLAQLEKEIGNHD